MNKEKGKIILRDFDNTIESIDNSHFGKYSAKRHIKMLKQAIRKTGNALKEELTRINDN